MIRPFEPRDYFLILSRSDELCRRAGKIRYDKIVGFHDATRLP
jgi:hypothetical protein